MLAWFVAQQMMMGVKRTKKTTEKTYVYLSGWMVAALRSQFGPLPDQSMHEKISVPALIKKYIHSLKELIQFNYNIYLMSLMSLNQKMKIRQKL